jgi:thymidylate synthase (FAD)
MKIAEMSVELVDHLGSDISVVNAARVSFAKQSEWVVEVKGNENSWHTTQRLDDKDVKLINYLANHAHWSPFAHAFVSFRIKAPLFCARQMGKHQVGLAWNEVSRRYVDEEPEFYVPSSWRGRPENMKQGSTGILDNQERHTNLVLMTTSDCLDCYNACITDGMAPEQARMVLPQNTMTTWIWSGSLAAFCRVCNLRLDPHAQQECRELVGALAGLLEPLFPVSYNALVKVHD